jgi:hypothetical protein
VEYNCSMLMERYFARENSLQQDCNLSSVDSVRRAEANVVKKILKFLKEYEVPQLQRTDTKGD